MSDPNIPDYLLDRIDFTEISVFLYDKLSWLAKLEYPTILSAYNAGLLGDVFPINPFEIEIRSKAFRPMMVTIDPESPSWADDVHDQVAEQMEIAAAVVVSPDGVALENLGLRNVWENRRGKVIYGVEFTREKKEKKRNNDGVKITGKRSETMKQYLEVVVLSMENMLSNYVSNTLSKVKREEWSVTLRAISDQRNSLILAQQIVEKCQHIEDGRNLSDILLDCGFTNSAFFVDWLAKRVAQSINSLILEIEHTRGSSIKLAVMHFCECVRKCRIARWLSNMWKTRCAHVVTVESGFFSSSSEDEGSEGSSSDEEYHDSRFERYQVMDLGALRLSNVKRAGAVSVRILRRDDFVVLSEAGAGIPDSAYKRMSKLGTTAVEPGDIIRVQIKRASKDPVSPQGGILRRAKGFLQKSVRTATAATPRGVPPRQFVRIDVVRYNRTAEEKRRDLWEVVFSVRHERNIDGNYMGMPFVVPVDPKARFALMIYENTISSTNQWVYRGKRVLDSPEDLQSKDKRSIRYTEAGLSAYMRGLDIAPVLKSGRYEGLPPFPSQGPCMVKEPSTTAGTAEPSCVGAMWAEFAGARGVEYGYWREFTQEHAYPKAEAIAKIVYKAAGEEGERFPGVSIAPSAVGDREYPRASIPILPPRSSASSSSSSPAGTPIVPPRSSASASASASPAQQATQQATQKATPPPQLPRDTDISLARQGYFAPASPASPAQQAMQDEVAVSDVRLAVLKEAPTEAARRELPVDDSGWSVDTFKVKADYADTNVANRTFTKGEDVKISTTELTNGNVYVSSMQKGDIGYIPLENIDAQVPEAWFDPSNETLEAASVATYLGGSKYSRRNAQLQAHRDNMFSATPYSKEDQQTLTIACKRCNRPYSPSNLGCPICEHQAALAQAKERKMAALAAQARAAPLSAPIDADFARQSVPMIQCGLCKKKYQASTGCLKCKAKKLLKINTASPLPTAVAPRTTMNVAMNRNAVTETLVPLMELIDTVVFIDKRRGNEDPAKIANLERSLRTIRCMAEERAVIYKRVLLGLDRGCRVSAELASGKLKPVWPGVFLTDGVTPIAAFSAKVLYFFHFPMDSVDFDDMAARVLDNPIPFLNALIFIVTRGASKDDAIAQMKEAQTRCMAVPKAAAAPARAPAQTCEEAYIRKWKGEHMLREGEWANLAKDTRDDDFSLNRSSAGAGVRNSPAVKDGMAVANDVTDDSSALDALTAPAFLSPPEAKEVQASVPTPGPELESEEMKLASAIGKCMHLCRKTNKHFLELWKASEKSIFSDGSSMFERSKIHLVIVPRPSLFAKIVAKLRAGDMLFRDFLRSHTIALSSGFQAYNRETAVETMDGSQQINIKYRFNTTTQRGQLRINHRWIPIDSLDRQGYKFFAVSY